MGIKYSLSTNNFKKSKDDGYVARVHTIAAYDLNDIAERMVKEGSILSAGNIKTLVNQAFSVIESFLAEGGRVNLADKVFFYPSIKGTFSSMTDGFETTRHSLELGSRIGAGFKDAVARKSSIEKINVNVPKPLVFEYIDVKSEEVNSKATAAATAAIHGVNLKFNQSAEDEGIFFVNTKDFSELKVEQVLKVQPGEIIFQTPQLTAKAVYNLEVRCRVNDGKTLRVGALEASLVGNADARG